MSLNECREPEHAHPRRAGDDLPHLLERRRPVQPLRAVA